MSKNLDFINIVPPFLTEPKPGNPEGARKSIQSKVFNNKKNLIISSELIKVMRSMDMNAETRDYFYKNQDTILENLKVARETHKKLSSTSSSSEGCYIATMTYGDYEHPKVLILRKFRDVILKKYFLGRLFIIFYYKTSPILVQILENKKIINLLIKKLIDRLVYFIK